MKIGVKEKLLNKIWTWRFNHLYGPEDVSASERNRLLLVLGTGRSVTTWLAKTLGHCSTPMRLLIEPLYHVVLRLNMSSGYDHCSILYYGSFDSNHRLARLYREFLASEDKFVKLNLGEMFVHRDEGPATVVVKEVHSLLSTEVLLKVLDCKAVLLTRDPVYVTDSLLNAQGLDTMYYRNEYRYIQYLNFLERYWSGQTTQIQKIFSGINSERHKRTRLIHEKVTTVALVKMMFEKIAAESKTTLLIEYEELCRNSIAIFKKIADFLSLEWASSSESFLKSTIEEKSHPKNHDPYSIFRNTHTQPDRPFIFLTDEEVASCRDILARIGMS